MMKSTKQTFIISVLSIVLCVAMLIGTTFAWFTDTVTSGDNKIVAGNLDIDLVMDKVGDGTYVSIAAEDGAIFGGDNSIIAQNKSNDTLWEPGKTQIVYLGVRNNGNLALKYNVIIKVTDGGLVGALTYAIIDGAKAADLTAATKWSDITSYPGVQTGDIQAGSIKAAEGGVLDEIAYDSAKIGETDYFALAVHMKEDAGNEYKDKNITIDVNVIATQVNAEKDFFDDQYDADVNYPVEFAQADPSNVNEILASLEPGSTVILQANEQSYGDLQIPAKLENITIKADDGAKLDDVVIPANAEIKNLTIDNVKFDHDANKALISVGNGAVIDNVVFENCNIKANNGSKYTQPLVAFGGNNSGTVTFENSSISDIGRGVYCSGSFGSDTVIKLINSSFSNFGSWVCQSNGNAKEVYIEGCTFENVDGIAKLMGTGCEKFTFINNTILPNADSDPAVYHYGHDNSSAKAFQITAKESITVSGNKIGTEDWTPGSANGLKSAN